MSVYAEIVFHFQSLLVKGIAGSSFSIRVFTRAVRLANYRNHGLTKTYCMTLSFLIVPFPFSRLCDDEIKVIRFIY